MDHPAVEGVFCTWFSISQPRVAGKSDPLLVMAAFRVEFAEGFPLRALTFSLDPAGFRPCEEQKVECDGAFLERMKELCLPALRSAILAFGKEI